MALKCEKKQEIWKKKHLRLNLLLLKCFLVTHNFLDWFEILATWTRLICATFLKKLNGNTHYAKKKQAAKVHCNPKMSGFWILNCFQTLKTTCIDMKI